jgi:hypothetical protein
LANNSIYYYSIKYLKKTEKNSSFYFFQCFKLYRIISKTLNVKSKIKLIQLFLKWLKLKIILFILKLSLNSKKITYLVNYFNFLLKLLIKYEIFQSNYLLDNSHSK